MTARAAPGIERGARRRRRAGRGLRDAHGRRNQLREHRRGPAWRRARFGELRESQGLPTWLVSASSPKKTPPRRGASPAARLLRSPGIAEERPDVDRHLGEAVRGNADRDDGRRDRPRRRRAPCQRSRFVVMLSGRLATPAGGRRATAKALVSPCRCPGCAKTRIRGSTPGSVQPSSYSPEESQRACQALRRGRRRCRSRSPGRTRRAGSACPSCSAPPTASATRQTPPSSGRPPSRICGNRLPV